MTNKKIVEVEYTTSPDTFELQERDVGMYELMGELHRMIQNADDGDKITITVRKPKYTPDPIEPGYDEI